MGIFSQLINTVSRTRVLASTSFEVLKRDRVLMAFPALILVTAVVIAVVNWVLVSLATVGLNAGTVDDPDRWATEPIVWLGVIASTLLISFVSVYFTTALCYGAWERFRGNTPTFESCISAANARLHVIVPWAILAGTVGLVFELLYRLPTIVRHMGDNVRHIPVIGPFAQGAAVAARILAFVLEHAWFLITYLVVPILVVEETGPVASCKRCFQLFRKTWGKSLFAQVAFELIAFLIMLPGLVVAAVLVLAGLGNPVLLAVGIMIGVAWVLLVIVAMSAVIGIFKMALYLYVTTGEVPGEFQGTGLEEVFASRKALKAQRKADRKDRRTRRKELGATWRNLWTYPSDRSDDYNERNYASTASSEKKIPDPPTT